MILFGHLGCTVASLIYLSIIRGVDVTQPDYVPVAVGSRLRETDELATPQSWITDRPAELSAMTGSAVEQGKFLGTPGPDSGYALKLARIAIEKIGAGHTEHTGDMVVVISAVAIKRAALYSRAPVIHDVNFAMRLFGYVGEIPSDLKSVRHSLIAGAAHDYFKVRHITETIPVSVLELDLAEVDSSAWLAKLDR